MKDLKKIILITENSRSFERGILEGFSRYSNVYGEYFFYMLPPYYLRTFDYSDVIARITKLKANGILTRAHNIVFIQQLEKLGLPIIAFDILYDEGFSNISQIRSNDFLVGKMGATYFLDCGFRHFAFWGIENMSWSQGRESAFCEEIANHGFEASIFNQKAINGFPSNRDISNVIKWLTSLSKPTGLMVCNDDEARYILELCNLAEIAVPEQISIIGVDNDELLCTLCVPPLSSIALDIQAAGYKAAELMARMIRSPDTIKETIFVEPTHIAKRQSSDILAIGDPDVSMAVRYIREYSSENIQPSDVADHTGISRRNLDRLFVSNLNRTVYEEITRVRIDQIQRMILETRMSMSQIAGKLHFNDPTKLSRFFKRETGMTLIAFRDKFRH
jgi:LacI family transcriptional regulator